MDTQQSNRGNNSMSLRNLSAVAILGLPAGTVLSLDGHSITLQRDDFVGIAGIPVNDDMHLLAVRAGAVRTQEEQSHGNIAAVTVGFMFSTNNQQSTLALARKFDPTTEEVSSTPLDEVTASNLCSQFFNGQMEPQRILSYATVLNENSVQNWKDLTRFISAQLLRSRGIRNGAKIVPGSYGAEASREDDIEAVDGTPVMYPPIPVIDNRKAARQSRHEGTKNYLTSLPPSERTGPFLHPKPHDFVFEDVLKRYYNHIWKDILGDIQLSYTLFLHLQCLSSLYHWRDLVAMLCYVGEECMERHVDFYSNLLGLLSRQVTTIDEDFFEDVEISGDNFLLPALRKVCETAEKVKDGEIQSSRSILHEILCNRFKDSFEVTNDSEYEAAVGTHDEQLMDMDTDDEDEKPVLITNEEIEASVARSSQTATEGRTYVKDEYPIALRKKYPILFAAKMEHEDILMTCARALDEKSDVSLVREAGDYLVEEVKPDTSEL